MAPPARNTAQDRSPNTGDTHQAAVREPPADPSERQIIVAERTSMWPSARSPCAPPSNRTSRLRASTPLTLGQGWLERQEPSSSRAATPAIQIFGPSEHQIGPSPSQTAVGVHLKVWPAGMMGVLAEAPVGARPKQPAPARIIDVQYLTRIQFRRRRDQAFLNSLVPRLARVLLQRPALLCSFGMDRVRPTVVGSATPH